MGNKLCKDCFKSRPPQPQISPKETELKDLGSNQELIKNETKRESMPVVIENPQYVPELNIEELNSLLEKIPLVLENPVYLTVTRSIKKKPPLKLELKKEKVSASLKGSSAKGESSKIPNRKRPSQAPIPEERESIEEIPVPKKQKMIHRKKTDRKQKKTLLKAETYKGSPAETSSAIKDLREYSFHPSLDNDILLYANNVVLEVAQSLWALNQNSTYEHINLSDYDVIGLLPDYSFKLQHKITMQNFRLSTVEFPAEDPLNLASLYSQGSIVDKLQTIKFFNKFTCKIASMYSIEASENFPKPLYAFKAVKLQEYGICSLEDLLARGIKFTPNQVIYFLKTISGLSQKSELFGIANRMLIPSNFLLAENLTDFKIHDYSLACALGAERVTSLFTWIKDFEDLWPPEITDILGSDFKKTYNPFQADIYTLALSCLLMMGVKNEELPLLKANEAAMEKKLNGLEEMGYMDTVKLLRGMLNIKPENRFTFKDIYDSLKVIMKSKGSQIVNNTFVQKMKQENQVRDVVFYERLGDLIYLITGEAESLRAYEEALRLVEASFNQGKEVVQTEMRLYEKMAKANFVSDQFGRAANCYLSLIDIGKKRLNNEKNLENIRNIIIMAQLRSEQMNYTLGSKLFVKAFEECLAYYDKDQDHIEFAYIYKGFGEMLVRIHNFQEVGIKYLYKAIEIVQKVEGIKSQVYFIFLDTLAEAFEYLKAVFNASQIYHRIVDEGRVVYGKVHPLLSKMYLKLAYAERDQDEYLKAQTYYKKGLVLQLKIFGEKSIEVAVTKLQLAKTYLNTHDWKKALKLLNESLEVTRKIMGEGTREVALVLNAIGLAYSLKPNHIQALDYYNKAYDTLKEIPEKDMGVYLDMSRFLEDIGALYALQQNKTKALSYYYQGLLMRKDVYGENSSEVGMAYERIGDVDLGFEDGNSALEAYKSALEIYMKNESRDFFGCIRLLEHVGKLTILQGESETDLKKENEYLAKGMDYLLKCVELQDIYLNEKSDEEVDWKHSLLNYIANIFFDKVEYDEALKYMNKALEMLEKKYKHPTEEMSDIFHNIGTIYYKKGEQEKALENAKKGYEIRLELFGKYDSTVAQSLSMMVKMYKGLNDKENAEKLEGTLNEMLKSVNVNKEEMKTGLLRLDSKKKFGS